MSYRNGTHQNLTIRFSDGHFATNPSLLDSLDLEKSKLDTDRQTDNDDDESFCIPRAVWRLIRGTAINNKIKRLETTY